MHELTVRGSKWSALALVFVVGCAALSPATAQSLGDRRMHATHEDELAHAAEFTDRACGTHLKTGFDWSGFDSAQLADKNPVSWCTAALNAIEEICSDAIGKEALSTKVKALTCGGAANTSVTLDSEGTVKFLFSMTPNQNKEMVRDYLNKHL